MMETGTPPPQACLKKGKVFRKLSQRTHGFARGRRDKESWGGGRLEPGRSAKKRKKGCQVVLGHLFVWRTWNVAFGGF